MTPAPFRADVAEAPEGAEAFWLRAADGVRIRAALWRRGERGTVFLFPGRTEYIEKYGPAAREFGVRGFAMVTVDWRGQGLADRPLADPMTGHVARFADYQTDIAVLTDLAARENMPRPWFLVSHSMGGAIALRALSNGLAVRAAVFSAPMWGILIYPALRPVAWAISTIGRGAGRGHLYAPGTSCKTYVLEAPFADNVLTRDPEMYEFMRRQVGRHGDLALGGPSLHWLNAALIECRALARLASPALPCYTALGMAERVVDPLAVHERMRRWPGGQLDLYPQAEHEVMMEKPASRARFYDAAARLFTEAG